MSAITGALIFIKHDFLGSRLAASTACMPSRHHRRQHRTHAAGGSYNARDLKCSIKLGIMEPSRLAAARLVRPGITAASTAHMVPCGPTMEERSS